VNESTEPTLAALLADVVRRVPDWGLVACAAAGSMLALVAFLFLPTWHGLVPLASLVASFGGWGIGERGQEAVGAHARAYRAIRLLAVLVSLAALGALIVQLFGRVLGTWIS
jgi:hypothetical protein